MKKKKIFGIGAVVLMISIAFMPIINGMQLNDDEENEYQASGTESYDLELIILEPPKLLEDESPFFTYDSDGEIIDTYVKYEINYKIKNNHIYPFSGETKTKIVNPDTGDNLYSFKDLFEWTDPLEPGDSRSFIKEIDVLCSEEESEDMEHFFADALVEFEAFAVVGQDINTVDNYEEA
ncbi:MAG: hypothetical protein JSW62_05840, partial [Thermoplasmatales archaeon]